MKHKLPFLIEQRILCEMRGKQKTRNQTWGGRTRGTDRPLGLVIMFNVHLSCV